MDATLQSTFQPTFQPRFQSTVQSNFQSSFQSTVQSTNISINQSRGVSINIATRIATYIATLGLWSLSSLYRKELRLVRTLSRAVDGHPTLSNIGLLLMGLALMVEIFLYA